MSHIWVGLAIAVLQVLAALFLWWQGRQTRIEVSDIHLIVNSERTSMVAELGRLRGEIERLKNALHERTLQRNP
jgi:hypothetical protein